MGKLEREAEDKRRELAHDKYVLRVYGITGDQYRELYAHQQGRCWICRRARGRTKSLFVDHNHRSGEVRGLLCDRCNKLLGHLRDDPEALFRAGLYLINPPSRDVL